MITRVKAGLKIVTVTALVLKLVNQLTTLTALVLRVGTVPQFRTITEPQLLDRVGTMMQQNLMKRTWMKWRQIVPLYRTIMEQPLLVWVGMMVYLIMHQLQRRNSWKIRVWWMSGMLWLNNQKVLLIIVITVTKLRTKKHMWKPLRLKLRQNLSQSHLMQSSTLRTSRRGLTHISWFRASQGLTQWCSHCW